MIDRLKRKLTGERVAIRTHVSERSLAAQLFLKQMGFVAVGVEHDWYPASDMDAYEFVYSVPVFDGAAVALKGRSC